jgi:aspartyl/asparaginyl-tRNA synthetase
MIAIFAIIISFISAGFVLYSITNNKAKVFTKKTSAPPSFWDDYNYCMKSIYNMKETDCVRVENLIDNMMYQYVEIIDYSLYIEKLSTLVDAYNHKMKSFLLSNNLN